MQTVSLFSAEEGGWRSKAGRHGEKVDNRGEMSKFRLLPPTEKPGIIHPNNWGVDEKCRSLPKIRL